MIILTVLRMYLHVEYRCPWPIEPRDFSASWVQLSLSLKLRSIRTIVVVAMLSEN